MKRAELWELSEVVDETAAGTNADVADRLIVKFETMRNNDPDVMIVESFFYFALKGGFRNALIIETLLTESRSLC